MSVADQLGLEEGSELLEEARQRWPEWVAADSSLGAVETFDDLRGWLPTVDREEADRVLLALAMLAAPDGGDDVAAAAALAKCLLPGACTFAGRLASLPPWEVLRDNQPVDSTSWAAVERIDELVASQLWIEVRSFPWRRLTKVAANILMNTKAGVLRECGDFIHTARADRTWAHTTVIEALCSGEPGELPGRDVDLLDEERLPTNRMAGRARWRPDLLSDHVETGQEPPACEELLDVLAWACERQVISNSDRYLLLCLVDEASRVRTRNTGRGYGGLLATEITMRVAPRVGLSEATVRRHGSRSMRALAEAAPGRFGHE